MRTKFLAAIALGFVVLIPSSAQNATDKFRFQPKKVPVGTVYHYVKSESDGSNPENIVLYVASSDRIEAFKFKSPESQSALVKADMDWTTFSAKRLDSIRLTPGGKSMLIATMAYIDAERAVEVDVKPMNRPPEKTAVKHLPFHIYNFDFASLNVSFRHLVDPKGSFVVGVADPTFQPDGPMFKYRGEIEISYVGEEKRNKVVCRKYKATGQGLENRGGFIWVNKAREHVEDMEIDLPDNPEWEHFKLRLRKVERKTPKQWETYVKATVK